MTINNQKGKAGARYDINAQCPEISELSFTLFLPLFVGSEKIKLKVSLLLVDTGRPKIKLVSDELYSLLPEEKEKIKDYVLAPFRENGMVIIHK